MPAITRSMFSLATRAGCSVLLLAGLVAGCSSSVDESGVDESGVDESSDDAATTASTTTAPTTTAETTEAAGERDPDNVCGVSVAVLFDEGAPRDRLTISNESEAGVEIAEVSFDLSSSVGQIIFDTVDGGSGVEVFQDFRVEDGAAKLANDPDADDGADSLDLSFSTFGSGESFTFSIDVDDQLVDSELGQIQVTGAEIEGATVTVVLADGVQFAGSFTSDSTARAESLC